MSKIPAVELPEICDECGQELLHAIWVDDVAETVAQFCPHKHSLIFSIIQDSGGGRSITRWLLQGPLSEEEARKIAQELDHSAGPRIEAPYSGRLQ